MGVGQLSESDADALRLPFYTGSHGISLIWAIKGKIA